MDKYEAYQETTQIKRGWSIWEKDGTQDGLLVAGNMTEIEAGRITALLNKDAIKAKNE